MGGIFVNYRTGDGDGPWAARLIADALVARFGRPRVFYASSSISPGSYFDVTIEQRLAETDILLAVIGREWLTATDESGNRRLDNKDDWVRHEIRTAFTRRIRVIPVLLDGMTRFAERDLPNDIAALARCQSIRVHHRESRDVAALVDEVAKLLPSGADEPWRARLRDAGGGAVLGAGVLLAKGYVLTCAHLVNGVGSEVIVDLLGPAHAGPAAARIATAERFVPATADRCGDLALLRLERPQAPGMGATLRRVALSWEREVHVYGFPRELEDGVYTRATLIGYGRTGGEWLQLNARAQGEQPVRAGFCGAGVVDDQTGDVLGIVVGEYDDAANLSWMIPVETILHHIPQMSAWVTGDSVADEVFSTPTEPGAANADLARIFTGWLAKRDTGDCVLIVVGPEIAAMYQLVAQSSPEQGSMVADPHQGSVPAPGSIDVAIDAAGKTVDEVARRILDRAGIRPDGTVSAGEQLRTGVPPMTIVVVGVDRAQRPEALLTEVIQPLVTSDSRVVLGFHRESSPGLALARSWDLGSIGSRLARLAERVNTIVAAQEQLAELRAHVRDPAPFPDRAATLHGALSALRQIAAREDDEFTRPRLERCERKVTQTLRQIAKAKARLTEWRDERDELRSLLEAYHAKAYDEGLVEDVEVDGTYRKAHELLWRAPTDLPVARDAVTDYGHAIRGARGAGPGKGRR